MSVYRKPTLPRAEEETLRKVQSIFESPPPEGEKERKPKFVWIRKNKELIIAFIVFVYLIWAAIEFIHGLNHPQEPLETEGSCGDYYWWC